MNLDEFFSLRKQYIESKFARLNEKQRQAVFLSEGPLLILAGAGSGKTTVLVNRIANLIMFGGAYFGKELCKEPLPEQVKELENCIKQGAQPGQGLASLLVQNPVKPWNILAITFTNKAAGELKARLASLLGQDVGGDVNASTFHSACVRILRRDAQELGFPKNFTIYDADDQQRVLKDLYKNLNIDDKFLPVRACASAIGRLKDRMISPKDAAQVQGDIRGQMVATVYAAYAKRCQSAGAMDFDDLIYYTVRLLREFAQVRQYYQNRFKYILVDEYQDTSVAQFMLVNLLCDEKNNVCVVGDDDQSIYRFRGATIENILSFENRFAGAQVIRLEQNYRSTSSILDAANCVIKNNTGRKGKTLWTEKGQGKQVQHYCAESEQDEAEYIAKNIGENVQNGAKLGEHAVLYRMNAQSSPIENYFARNGILYKIIGGLRFNDRREIRDLHAYMSIVANPADDLRLRRIINEPSRKIGAVTVDAIAEIAQGLSVPMLEVISQAASYPLLSRGANALQGFYAVYQKLVKAQEELDLAAFAKELPEITGYRLMLEALGEEGLSRIENMGQFFSNVKAYAEMHKEEASLQGYLEEIALISDLDNYDEDADRVILMTMHSAKGLEFPYVYIVGLEEGVFPGEQARFNKEDLEEERRLCYVGITRAKKELVLCSAESRMLYGQTRRNRQSRFLEEIDETLLNRVESSQTGVRLAAFGGNVPPKSRGAGLPSYTPPKPAKPSAGGVVFAVGDAVEHKVFGKGRVKSLTPVAGDCIVEIDFEKAGTKKTMANFAPLTKL